MDEKETKIAVTYLTEKLPAFTRGLYKELDPNYFASEMTHEKLTVHLLTESLTFLSKNL